MKMRESILENYPLFTGMEHEHLTAIEGLATHATYAANQHLFRAGEQAESCYLIRHGRIAVEVFDATRGPIIVQTLGESNVLGWSWLVAPYRWCFDARATELTRVIVLSGSKLLDLCESNHDLGYALLKRFTYVFADRLHAARYQLLDVYGVHA